MIPEASRSKLRVHCLSRATCTHAHVGDTIWTGARCRGLHVTPRTLSLEPYTAGDPYLDAGAVTRPKYPVMYLNQEADLIKVYCDGEKVFCDLRLIQGGKMLTRVPEHAIQ